MHVFCAPLNSNPLPATCHFWASGIGTNLLAPGPERRWHQGPRSHSPQVPRPGPFHAIPFAFAVAGILAVIQLTTGAQTYFLHMLGVWLIQLGSTNRKSEAVEYVHAMASRHIRTRVCKGAGTAKLFDSKSSYQIMTGPSQTMLRDAELVCGLFLGRVLAGSTRTTFIRQQQKHQ